VPRTAICLVCAADTIAADLRLAAENRARVDLLELRADHLRPEELAAAARFPRLVDLPVILTVRRTRDGGKYAGDERERVAVIERLTGPAAGTAFAYVDLEEDLDAQALAARLMAAGTRIIRSFHDFAGVPADFSRRVASLARGPREIPKAAVMPGGVADLLRLLEASAALKGEKIVLGMGDFGFPTRVLAPKLGSFLCYASPPGFAVAPGQVDPATLEDVFRFRGTGPSTSVYGVIGNPVLHSRSPLIHNMGFTALGIDAVYLPFPVDRVEDFWAVAGLLEVMGLSVTVPFKQAVIPHLAESDLLVRDTGACNTMWRRAGSGSWSGTNTDVGGFLAPLRALFGGEVPPGLAATVIGAGGAARAVVHALLAQKARVLVLNRSPGRAAALAQAFAVSCAGLDPKGYRQAEKYGDVVVQTSSAGMAPNAEIDPAPGLPFKPGAVAYDLVYAPDETAFLRRARAAGCRIVRGRQMLVAQAMEQFHLFTGSDFPAALRQELESAGD
jgi:3-dehydroquinate dehydratase/shikimate dehydrogenase